MICERIPEEDIKKAEYSGSYPFVKETSYAVNRCRNHRKFSEDVASKLNRAVCHFELGFQLKDAEDQLKKGYYDKAIKTSRRTINYAWCAHMESIRKIKDLERAACQKGAEERLETAERYLSEKDYGLMVKALGQATKYAWCKRF